MKPYRKILFVCDSDTCRGPMAEAIAEKQHFKFPKTIGSRGLVVLFPEPVNPKVTAVLKAGGLEIDGHMSMSLEEKDFQRDTLILTMDQQQKSRILHDYENARNVFALTEIVGEKGDVKNPYGGPLTVYGECFQTMKELIGRLVKVLNDNEEEEVTEE